MNTITALVIDDEQESRSSLCHYIQRYCPSVAVVGQAASVSEGAQAIIELSPQLLFLDINLSFESGFDLFKQFGKPAFETIFVTAHDEYALEAIKQHALDYLLKPLSIDELINAIERVRVHVEEKTAAQRLNTLLDSFNKQQAVHRVSLPVAEGFVYVDTAEIIYCEAVANYTRFHFADGRKLLVSQTLKIFDEAFSAYGFIRVHSHYLINISFIEKYQKGRGGVVTLKNKMEIAVSQRKKEEFLKRLSSLES